MLHNALQLFVAARHTYAQQLAEQEYQKCGDPHLVRELVPKHYHGFLHVFSKEALERLSEHHPTTMQLKLCPRPRCST